MKEITEKKGLFQRLTGSSKPKKSTCCSIELEEIPEESFEKKDTDKKEKKNSCCG